MLLGEVNDVYTDRIKNTAELLMNFPIVFEVEEKVEEELNSDKGEE